MIVPTHEMNFSAKSPTASRFLMALDRRGFTASHILRCERKPVKIEFSAGPHPSIRRRRGVGIILMGRCGGVCIQKRLRHEPPFKTEAPVSTANSAHRVQEFESE